MEDKLKLESYMPLVHKISLSFPHQFRKDLVNDGYIALHRAAKSFDPDLGYPFSTYCRKEIYYTFLKYVKNEYSYTSLDMPIYDEDGNTTEADMLADDFDLEHSIEARDYYQKNLNGSSLINRFIKERYFEEGMSSKEIIKVYSELIQITDRRKLIKIITQ